VWQKQNKCQDLRNTSASVKHGGGNVMAGLGMHGSSIVDQQTCSSLMSELKIHRSHIMSGQSGDTCGRILRKYIQLHESKLAFKEFLMQSDNVPEYMENPIQDFISTKK
jgi:hypothetical protein